MNKRFDLSIELSNDCALEAQICCSIKFLDYRANSVVSNMEIWQWQIPWNFMNHFSEL